MFTQENLGALYIWVHQYYFRRLYLRARCWDLSLTLQFFENKFIKTFKWNKTFECKWQSCSSFDLACQLYLSNIVQYKFYNLDFSVTTMFTKHNIREKSSKKINVYFSFVGTLSIIINYLTTVFSSGRAIPHVFEHASCIGGTWVFTPQTGKDSRLDIMFVLCEQNGSL